MCIPDLEPRLHRCRICGRIRFGNTYETSPDLFIDKSSLLRCLYPIGFRASTSRSTTRSLNIVLDRDGYAKLVDLGSAEIGPSNVLKVVDKFVCFWTSFVKLQCRDIWQFAKTVQRMVENKVSRKASDVELEYAEDFIRHGLLLEKSDTLEKSHYDRMKSHPFFKSIYWNELLRKSIEAPSSKIHNAVADSRSFIRLLEDITSNPTGAFVPLPDVDVVEWRAED